MKTAIVTGGSRGIGNAIVRELAARGADTVFTYKSGEKEAISLEQELNKEGFQVHASELDITDAEACQKFVNDLYKEKGAPDILVNNAGITQDSLLFAMKQEQWQQVVDTNLNGVFNMTQTVVFHMMKAKKGRIVNLSSISGIRGIKGQCNYSATKAALIGFTKALAKEASPLGIAVNVVAPGGVETGMTKALSPQAYEEMVRDIPMKRLCTTQEVSNVVAWLALDSPLYLTGTTIVLDGGLGSL